ncbi:MAG: phosphoribosylformylglycinamidine synthase subunit PurQ, partial [Tritonibacter mobilis]|nr:phosphoribosylformylglycinamidine synthase subunit PurQ [Tritonibacter mobilis]
MKAAVVVFPGSNCDRDLAVAFEQAGFDVSMVWHKDSQLPEGVDIVGVPGGFSYGDYLRCGAMAQYSPVMAAVRGFADSGGPVLGICNGFQMLTETGLLPGALLRNGNLKFVCKDVHVKVETSQSLFTARYETGQALRIPVAHHDGNYYADAETLERLEERGQIAFRYCAPDGTVTAEANPNGSLDNIAGVTNEAKTVLGLMP